MFLETPGETSHLLFLLVLSTEDKEGIAERILGETE